MGHGVLGVVDTADDDGAVGVSLEEVHDHLVADARDEHGAPALARPELADPHPARAVFVALAQAVPVEVDLHPAVLVGVDLLGGRAHHDGSLAPLHPGPGRDAQGPKGGLARHAVEGVGVADAVAHRARLQVLVLLAAVAHPGDQKALLVEPLAVVAVEGEVMAAAEAGAVALPLAQGPQRLGLLPPNVGQGRAPLGDLVQPRVVVDLQVGVPLARLGRLEIQVRLLEVEVVEGHRA